MAANKDPYRWKRDHNPEARPEGCNGKYGTSGAAKHRYYGEAVCELCKESARHYQREGRRGQKYPRFIHPCGTWQAAKRHRYNKESLDLPCRIAEAAYTAKCKAERQARAKLAA